MASSIFIYPALSSQDQANDFVTRLAWYMAPYLAKIDSILLTSQNADWVQKAVLAPHMDRAIEGLMPAVKAKIRIVSEAELSAAIIAGDRKRDAMMLIDSRAEATMPAELAAAKDGYLANAGFYRVDPVRTRQEGSFYLWCGLNRFIDSKAVVAQNKLKLAALAKDIGHWKKAYVFGTGPSFSDFVDSKDFSDGLCIAANSIIKNTEALRKLKPKIICAADPIYHAGCSSYAGAFRETLVTALEESGAWFICPLRDSAVYRSVLPPHLLDRMICVPFEAKKGIPTNLNETFHLHPYPNVLTLLLMPLATTFADDVHIIGCDGRRLLDDSFFWSHDKKVQFNDQMAEIQAAHPGFFAIDYNDYYLDHCRDLENVLVASEAAGHKILTETPSLIPALSHREAGRGTAAVTDLRTLVMLDPDAKDDWGHFLAYDQRISSAAKAIGVDLYLLSRKELLEKFCPADAKAMIPVFSVNSWTIGNKKPAERANVMRFATELDQGLRTVEEMVPTGDIGLFFYVGSIEMAEALEFLLSEHPRLRAVVNLFWSYAHDHNDQKYRDRWLFVTRRLAQHPRISLMHSTYQIAKEFKADWNVDLPVLEHPSTTFSDIEAKKLAATKIAVRDTAARPRYRVIFPGGARGEKGFVLSIETVAQLRGVAHLEVALRARVDNVSGPALKRAYEGLDKTGIEILDADLSDEQFIGMIANSDLVVLPYHVEGFRKRTSGILVDSMLLGKPVVVLKDTWLADVVDEEKIGVVAEPTASGIAAAIEKIVANYAQFADLIETARHAYLAKNSWDSLVRTVVGLASGRPADSVGVGQNGASVLPKLQLELEQLRANFAALDAHAQELEKRLARNGGAPIALPPGPDLLSRLIDASDPASYRLLLTTAGSEILLRPVEARAKLKAEGKFRESLDRALAALPADDAHKVHFLKVQARLN